MITLLSVILSLAVIQADTPATCELRGRVTDKESGLPIARAIVRIAAFGRADLRTSRTDEDGRYELKGLTPGEYRGLVDAGEFRATHVTASIPTGGAVPRRIVLKAGERVEFDIALSRAAAITVRVVDEWGWPLSGVHVSVKSPDGGNLTPWDWARMTDDRGRVRLFRLVPGRYIICAQPGGMGFSEAADAPRRDRFVPTCYPSAANDAQAEAVEIGRDDVEDVEIRMRRGLTYRISGTVLGVSGVAAPDAALRFTRFAPDQSATVSIMKIDPDGGFTVANVLPGDYGIEAFLGGPERPEQRRPLEVGFQAVHVESSDVEGIVVSMAKAVDVAGRLMTEDSSVALPRLADRAPVSVNARLVGDWLPWAGTSRFTPVNHSGEFLLEGMFGRRIVEILNVPRGWYVKSIQYGGREIIDEPTEFKAGRDPAALEVLLSNRGATVSGRVQDERGDPAGSARVLLFPTDPARWTWSELTTAVASATGAFTLGPRRRGDYFVVALEASARIPDPGDRDRFALLAESAERIALGESEDRTMELRVVRRK
jgi:hypothetical protein